MTSQIFKCYALSIAAIFVMAASCNILAQEPSLDSLIAESVSVIQQDSPESYANCIAKLKRIDAMFPDSLQAKYQIGLQCLNYSVMNPHAAQAESFLKEAQQQIGRMEKMQNADMSDVCTLRGYLYMVRIVQDPATNGQRYYLNVIENYEKALKLKPDNSLTKFLYEKFQEGMKKAY